MEPDVSSCFSNEQEIFLENTEKDMFETFGFVLFEIKLQVKLMIPSSTTNTIIEDYLEIHAINQSNLIFHLKEKLITLGVSDTQIGTVIDILRDEDIFRACSTEALHTDHCRKTVFKTASITLIQCSSVLVMMNQAENALHNISLWKKKTIESQFQCKSVREHQKLLKIVKGNDDVFQDVWDGTNCVEKILSKNPKYSLGVILYQDSFVIVNPLGSGKKKHNILAVYLTLAKILPQNRSGSDQMQLVLLCK